MHSTSTLSLLLLTTVVVSTEAKGTRGYSRPGGSNLWKYGAAGALGLYAGYKIHSFYDDVKDYSEYYDRQPEVWRSRHRKRTYANCDPRNARGPAEDDTETFVVAQFVILNQDRLSFDPFQVELDLFHELVFRNPCNPPTQVVILRECGIVGRIIGASDRSDQTKCLERGDTTSIPAEHTAAQRKLLQGPNLVYEVGIGADSYTHATQLRDALQEAISDTHNGRFQQHYDTLPTIPSMYIEDSAAGSQGSGYLFAVGTTVAALSFLE